MFYPLIDMDSTDEQPLDNAVTLPRYTDGNGVQAFLVATNPYIGGIQFYLNYTNQEGVAGRISQYAICNTSGNIGMIVHSGITAWLTGPFVPLMLRDRGIRSIESITFMGSNGGMGTLVLCKPLFDFYVREVNAPAEWDLITMLGGKLPRVYDGAYINFLIEPNGTIAAQYIIGDMTFIWR
jgi:hypothetical protein